MYTNVVLSAVVVVVVNLRGVVRARSLILILVVAVNVYCAVDCVHDVALPGAECRHDHRRWITWSEIQDF